MSGWLRTIEAAERERLPLADDLSRGSALFALECGVCHGLNGPRVDIVPRVRRLTADGLEALLQGLGARSEVMPPFAGNAADRKALATYLESVASPRIPSPEAP